MLVKLPCIAEESILGRSAKENSAASVAVIGHRRECARLRTDILNLGPMFAVPTPCVAKETIQSSARQCLPTLMNTFETWDSRALKLFVGHC
jgi:hypothetical protein